MWWKTYPCIHSLQLLTLQRLCQFCFFFFLWHLIVQIQKIIFYFEIKNQNYQNRNTKHIMITTLFFNLYLFTCLKFSFITQHKATLHIHPYLYCPVLCGFSDCPNYVTSMVHYEASIFTLTLRHEDGFRAKLKNNLCMYLFPV